MTSPSAEAVTLTESNTCVELDCDRRDVKAHGLCTMHYARHGRAGTLPKRPSEDERFWAKVDKTDTCWLWTGALLQGYGLFGKNGRSVRAHRWAYTSLVGPIPDDLPLDHLCRVRNCVNPDHLEPVTVAENNRRGLGGQNLKNGDTCRKGLHPWPESAKVHSDGYARCVECVREWQAKQDA